jgi:hypothetical protein
MLHILQSNRGKAYCIRTTTNEVGDVKSQVPWSYGLFSEEVIAKPLAGEATIVRWRPIFDIPLDRAHNCVLYARHMIIEKVVHMPFMHVWTIGDVALQKVAIVEM